MRRRKPPIGDRELILIKQRGKCAYCNRPLDGTYNKRGNTKQIQLHWDHFLPFSLTNTNSAGNWVAACDSCNLRKSNKIFSSVQEVKEYLKLVVSIPDKPILNTKPLRRCKWCGFKYEPKLNLKSAKYCSDQCCRESNSPKEYVWRNCLACDNPYRTPAGSLSAVCPSYACKAVRDAAGGIARLRAAKGL